MAGITIKVASKLSLATATVFLRTSKTHVNLDTLVHGRSLLAVANDSFSACNSARLAAEPTMPETGGLASFDDNVQGIKDLPLSVSRQRWKASREGSAFSDTAAIVQRGTDLQIGKELH